MLRHLQKNDFDITLLTGNVEKTKQAFPGLQAIEADYHSPTDLQDVLQHTVGDQAALVSLINRHEFQAQINLLSATATSGIHHIIPSSFGIGMHSTFPDRNPVFENKARMKDTWCFCHRASTKRFNALMAAGLPYNPEDGVITIR